MTSRDPAENVLHHIAEALRLVYHPDSSYPPHGGGTLNVRLFAGDGIPLAAWHAHADGGNCDEPLLWVRLIRRYRTKDFPAPYVGPNTCSLPMVLAVEIGVARCAVVELQPDWPDYAEEAATALDDSWRLDEAICQARKLLRRATPGTTVSADAIVPYGPEGGVIAQIATLYVQP